MNTRPYIYDSHVSFRTTPEVKDLFYKAQKADKKRFNDVLLKVCKYILDNPTNIIEEEKMQLTDIKEVKESAKVELNELLQNINSIDIEKLESLTKIINLLYSK